MAWSAGVVEGDPAPGPSSGTPQDDIGAGLLDLLVACGAHDSCFALLRTTMLRGLLGDFEGLLDDLAGLVD